LAVMGSAMARSYGHMRRRHTDLRIPAMGAVASVR
jgi:hypothetical protein